MIKTYFNCKGSDITFNLVTIEDTIRIPPEKFNEPLEKVALEQLRMKYVGVIDEELGYLIAVTNVKVSPVGKIIPGDAATHHKVTFSLLTFLPKVQEIIEGEVVEIADFGVFVRIGPVDALLHISQLMDDFITYDEKQGVLMSKEMKRRISVGDRMRVRITAVSLGKGAGFGKIGVTTRQPFLGKLEWIEEELKKLKSETESENKKT